MAIAITSQFATPDAPMQTAITIAAVFVFFGLASASTWAVLGGITATFLGNRKPPKMVQLRHGVVDRRLRHLPIS